MKVRAACARSFWQPLIKAKPPAFLDLRRQLSFSIAERYSSVIAQKLIAIRELLTRCGGCILARNAPADRKS